MDTISFTWSAEEIRRVGYRVVDLVAEHLDGLAAGPVFKPMSADAARGFIDAPLPRAGEDVTGILDRFAGEIAPFPFGNGHPRFYGWVNSPPAPIGVMAEMLAAAMNPSVAGGNHAAVWVERQVAEWFKAIVGYPRESMAMLVSGGSMAALTALAVARHRACARSGSNVRSQGLRNLTVPDGAQLLVYKTAEGHSCHQKALELLGLGADSVRSVAHDGDLRMRPDALDSLLREDLAAGHIPVAVIATAGTVNTGVIDPIDAIVDICARHGVWLHVDAAYGGPAILTEAYADILAAIARADSLALDPHKWMYVPVDAGMVLVRDASVMREAFSLVPPYLRSDDNLTGVQGPPWFSEYGVEQTRPFRALKVWAALRYFGTDGYRDLVNHDLTLARHLATRARESEHFVVREPTSLSIVCFRAEPPAVRGNPTGADALNRRALESLQLSGAGFLSGTVIDDRFWLRACIVNPRATIQDVDALLDAVIRAVHNATTTVAS